MKNTRLAGYEVRDEQMVVGIDDGDWKGESFEQENWD